MKYIIVLIAVSITVVAGCKSDDDMTPDIRELFEECLVYADGEFRDLPLDQEPVYIHGGSDSLYVHLLSEINYPAEARENSIQGLTFTSFEISETGILENIRDTGSEHEILGNATIEALSMYDGQVAFIPAILDGENVRVQKTIRVKYELE